MNEKNCKLLVIDDDPRVIQTKAELYPQLLGPGYPISLPKAARRASKLPLREDPAVVLLDIMMPGMDGWEVLRQFAEHDVKSTVIMLTALNEVPSVLRAIELGCLAVHREDPPPEEERVQIIAAFHLNWKRRLSHCLQEELARIMLPGRELISRDEFLDLATTGLSQPSGCRSERTPTSCGGRPLVNGGKSAWGDPYNGNRHEC